MIRRLLFAVALISIFAVGALGSVAIVWKADFAKWERERTEAAIAKGECIVISKQPYCKHGPEL